MKKFYEKKIKEQSQSQRLDYVDNTKINNNKKENNMETKEKVKLAAEILQQDAPKVKKIKKDKGLLERTESSITVLTDDNKELLRD